MCSYGPKYKSWLSKLIYQTVAVLMYQQTILGLPDPNFGKLKKDHRSSRAIRDHSRPISRKNRKQVSFSNHRDISATFRDCRGPSVPIETCLELSGPSQHTSGPLSYIRSLSKTIWTHQYIFGDICLHSATIRTHQLHSGSVEDHLYPSRHFRSY